MWTCKLQPLRQDSYHCFNSFPKSLCRSLLLILLPHLTRFMTSLTDSSIRIAIIVTLFFFLAFPPPISGKKLIWVFQKLLHTEKKELTEMVLVAIFWQLDHRCFQEEGGIWSRRKWFWAQGLLNASIGAFTVNLAWLLWLLLSIIRVLSEDHHHPQKMKAITCSHGGANVEISISNLEICILQS